MSIYKVVLLFLLSHLVLNQGAEELMKSLIRKLLKLCNEEDSINLLDCQQSMIENDKKTGNFKEGYNYTRESIYMMYTYDNNKDGRLDKKELYRMGLDLADGRVEQHTIDMKMPEIEKELAKQGKEDSREL